MERILKHCGKHKGNHVSLLNNKNQEILKYLSHISVDEFFSKVISLVHKFKLNKDTIKLLHLLWKQRFQSGIKVLMLCLH